MIIEVFDSFRDRSHPIHLYRGDNAAASKRRVIEVIEIFAQTIRIIYGVFMVDS